MDPIPGAELILVSDTPTVLYSGMVPALVSGQLSREEAEIDLVRLCHAARATLVVARAKRLEAAAKRLHLEGRPPISYDVASLNVGSRPAIPPGVSAFERDFSVKPLDALVSRIESLKRDLVKLGSPATVAVVGSGAGGVEICLALKTRLADLPLVNVALLESSSRALPGYSSAARRIAERALEARGISLYRNARAERREGDSLVLSDGSEIPCVASIWATKAAPHEILSKSDGLALDPAGFLKVAGTLQSESDPSLFAAGDCASLSTHPDLPKAGVYAVREGPVLWENIKRFLRGERLRTYRPQRFFLTILNLGDGTAMACWGPFAGRGEWAWRFKRLIDGRWMRRFQELPPAMDDSPSGEKAMHCGGCGSKVGPETLREALASLDLELLSRPGVLVGVADGEDASVTRPPPGKVEIQSVDYFRSFLSDPLLLGRIAAMNAISDVYAMNGKPFSALAIVTLPYGSSVIQGQWLRQVLEGSVDTLDREGAVLAGGHTTEGPELAIGFSVTGYADEKALFRKGGLSAGEKLILTKPIGTGALLAALARGECKAAWLKDLIAGMLQSNREAARILAEHGARGCTDVTGFGVAGHALEMAERSRCSIRLFPHLIPLYEGFEHVTRIGIVSTLHAENAKASRRIDPGSSALVPALFDPQTSGGLLAGIPGDRADAAVAALRAAGYPHAQIVGDAIERESGSEATLLTLA